MMRVVHGRTRRLVKCSNPRSGWVNMRRSRWAVLAGTTAGVLAGVGLGLTGATLVSASPPPTEVLEAFGNAGKPAEIPIDVAQAELITSGAGPEGMQLSYWSAPMLNGTGGVCRALITSVRGAPSGGKTDRHGAACSSASGKLVDIASVEGQYWKSPSTGDEYMLSGGLVDEGVTTVRLEADGKSYLTVPVHNGGWVGWFPQDAANRDKTKTVPLNADGTPWQPPPTTR